MVSGSGGAAASGAEGSMGRGFDAESAGDVSAGIDAEEAMGSAAVVPRRRVCGCDDVSGIAATGTKWAALRVRA
jgi:hypothetical protein